MQDPQSLEIVAELHEVQGALSPCLLPDVHAEPDNVFPYASSDALRLQPLTSDVSPGTAHNHAELIHESHENLEDKAKSATTVVLQKGWYETWDTFPVTVPRKTLQTASATTFNVWAFSGNFTKKHILLEHIPEHPLCDLTYIVYYNPFSDSCLTRLQHLQSKTAKQIHWIIVYPELKSFNDDITSSSRHIMRGTGCEVVCCLADLKHSFNMLQNLFAHVSLVFPSSVNPTDVDLWVQCFQNIACEVTIVSQDSME